MWGSNDEELERMWARRINTKFLKVILSVFLRIITEIKFFYICVYYSTYLFWGVDHLVESWVVDLVVVMGRKCFRENTTASVSSCFDCHSVIWVCRRHCRFLLALAVFVLVLFGLPNFLILYLWTKPETNNVVI